jgi:hypothetical protein
MVVKRLASWLCLLVTVVALSGCGESTTTTTNAAGQTVTTCHIRFARTKFVLHTGLALGAFHRYIYKPYRAGSFKQGAPGRKKALAKAGASALFAYHELKVAARDARCDGKTLRKLASPLSSALEALSSLRTALGAGDLGAIGAAGAALDNLTSQTRQQGVHVKDVNG